MIRQLTECRRAFASLNYGAVDAGMTICSPHWRAWRRQVEKVPNQTMVNISPRARALAMAENTELTAALAFALGSEPRACGELGLLHRHAAWNRCLTMRLTRRSEAEDRYRQWRAGPDRAAAQGSVLAGTPRSGG